jgi:hypothetical protein
MQHFDTQHNLPILAEPQSRLDKLHPAFAQTIDVLGKDQPAISAVEISPSATKEATSDHPEEDRCPTNDRYP